MHLPYCLKPRFIPSYCFGLLVKRAKKKNKSYYTTFVCCTIAIIPFTSASITEGLRLLSKIRQRKILKTMNDIKGIIWDFGGVITESPFEAFNRFEAKNGIPVDFIRGVNSTNPSNNAWALFESSKITLEQFDDLFYDESSSKGYGIRGKDLVPLLSCSIRTKMVAVLSYLSSDYKQLCLTNNLKTGMGAGMAHSRSAAIDTERAMGFFSHVIESSKVGFRKPEKEIYELACKKMGLRCEEIAYLDDLGINLKPARLMGMRTIKVLSEGQAISDLGNILDLDLAAITG